MSYKKPERWPTEQWRWTCETVGRAIIEGWAVTQRCSVCQAELATDLWLIAGTRGPAASLWNRTTPCRTIRQGAPCPGRMAFWARPPQLQTPFKMHAPARHGGGDRP